MSWTVRSGPRYPNVDPLIANAFYNVNRRSLLTLPEELLLMIM